VAELDGVADRTAADALKGWAVHVPRTSFPTPAPGEYYWVDLIGLLVVNREGEALGTVRELLDTGAHSVLVITAGGDAPDRLVPFVDAYVDHVDLPQRRITVDWGLDY
jgi:16S rRNA processing protein RimM